MMSVDDGIKIFDTMLAVSKGVDRKGVQDDKTLFLYATNVSKLGAEKAFRIAMMRFIARFFPELTDWPGKQIDYYKALCRNYYDNHKGVA